MLEFCREQIGMQGELFVRLIIACLLGGVIGFERKNRNKGAGMRTHSLVCLGAALFMIVSKYGFGDVPSFDAARVAAQVVSGIGFLGAGIIFIRNNAISGLTTAAGIWVTAGIGLSTGAGLCFLAIAGTILMIAVQILLHNIDFLAREPYRSGLKIVVRNDPLVVQKVEEILEKDKIEISVLKISKINGEDTKMDMEVVYPAGYNKTSMINRLSYDKDIVTVRG